MIVSDYSIRNRITVAVVSFAILVVGVYSYIALPRESAPDVTIPFIVVTTTYSGVSPADMESTVTVEIEKKLKGLADVREIRSTSSEGSSTITIEFEPTIDIDTALQKVRDKVDQAKGELPAEADDPLVREINISEFPVMMVNVTGDVGLTRLKEIAEDIQDDVEGIAGVLSVNVIGGREREIRVEVDPDRLAQYQIPVLELIRLVAVENVNVSGGSVDTPEAKFQVRVPAEFVDPREIETLVVMTREGRPIYLTDVARVVDTFKDRASYSRLNGRESVSLSIQKRAGENVIRMTDEIKASLEQWRQRLPEGVRLDVSFDVSDDIRLMVSDLENNILTGFILVAAVVFLAMGWRNAIFVSLAIPMSMLITFAVVHALGITLNFVTLFALMLALGMLVDNAVVIVENIYRHMQEGNGRLRSAQMGAAEVAWPVVASTMTTVAAFVPLLFWPGIIGQFMGFLPKTLVVALLASLFVALVVNPAVTSMFMRVKRRVKPSRRHEHPFVGSYARLLGWSLDNHLVTMATAVFLLVAAIALYGRFGKGVEFFPEADPNRAFVNIRAPEGASLDSINDIALEVERRLAPFDNIERVIANVGAGSGDFFSGVTGLNTARISIDFRDFADRVESSMATVEKVRAAIGDVPGAEIVVEKESHGPPVGTPVSIEIAGEDFDTLAAIARDTRNRIETIPGLVDLKDDYEQARPELQFDIDRSRAKILGLDTDTIGYFLKTAVLGTKVGSFRQGEDEYDITVRLAPEQRDDPDKIMRLHVPAPDGRMVPLSSLASVRYAGGLGAITRVDQRRVITVTANNEGRLPTEILNDARARLANMQLPQGYSISYTGQDRDMIEAQSFLAKAFVAALLLIVMVLVMEFNSMATPLIIMASVVFSLIGVFTGLLLTGKPFGVIMTGVGSISLAGVVVNNAIVLLDYVEKLRARGLERREALVQAGMTRLRPVLLTASTTILGLMPMAIGISYDFTNMRWQVGSESSQWWGQMAVAVIFGLAFATLLTLLLVPTMYSILDSFRTATGHPWRPRGYMGDPSEMAGPDDDPASGGPSLPD